MCELTAQQDEEVRQSNGEEVVHIIKERHDDMHQELSQGDDLSHVSDHQGLLEISSFTHRQKLLIFGRDIQ